MAVRQIGIRISVDAQSGTIELHRLGQEFDNLGNGAEQASARATRSLGTINTSMRDLVVAGAAVSLVTKAVHELTGALIALPSGAFDFTKNLEVSEVGMAGILSSMTAINGKQTEYNQAVAISSGMIAKLNDDALRTAATSQELVTVFQALLAPGLAARMTLDEVRQLTVVGANAVKSIGLGSHQVVQELRDLVAGGITAASSTLATALGLKDSDIAKAKASSEGLFAFLMERLKGFQASSEAYSSTIKGRLDQIKEGSIRVAAEGFDPMIQAAKQALGEVSALFVTFKADGQVQLNGGLVDGLKDISNGAVQAAAAAKIAVTGVWEHRDAVVALIAAYASVKAGKLASEAVGLVNANIELANASRLAAMQAAAQGTANAEVAATSRMKIAALLGELTAQQAAAQAEVDVASAKIANLGVTREAIVLSRSDVLAKMEATRTTIAQAEAQIVAARAAGAQSIALALVREGTEALSAAQARQAALMSELALLGRQQASVQAALAASTEAQAVATTAATAAQARLAATQEASLISGQALGGVMGFLGGGVGLVTTAIMLGVTAWAIWGDSAGKAEKKVREDISRSTTEIVADLDQQIIKLRQRNSLAAAGMADLAKQGGEAAQQMGALQQTIDKAQAAGPAKDQFAEVARLETIRKAQAEYGLLAQRIAQAKGEQERLTKSEGNLSLTLTGSEQAWRKANDGIKTSSAAQQEYQTKLSASRLAWETYKSSLQASGADAQTIAVRQAEQKQVESALAAERDKHIKQLGAGAATAQSHAMSAQIEAVKQGYKAIAAQTADGLDEVDSLRKQGLIDEYTAVQRRAELQLHDMDAQKQALQAELALAQKKKDSGTEQARLAGHLTELEQKRVALQNKSARDLQELLVKPMLEQVSANYKAADSIMELADKQEAANDAFGKSKTAIEQMTLATIKQQLQEAEGSDSFDEKYIKSLNAKLMAQERYVKALQGTEFRDLMRKEQDWLDQAKERVSLYEDEQQLAGLTNIERAKIVATRQIELRLAKELAEIEKANLSDTEKETLRIKAREAAQIDSSAAVNKVVQEDWSKSADQINQSLTDALMNGGKSGADYLKNLFKTMVLRPIISGVMSPIAGAVSSVVNSGLSAIGLGSGSSAGTSALGSLASSALGSITLGGSTISAIGSSVATGISAGLSGTSMAGAVGAYNAAGMTGVASGLSVGSSIGTTLAAIPGWGWAALAVAAVGAAALGGKKDSRYGAAYDYTAAGGTQVVGGPNAGVDFAGKSTAADLTVQGINAMLERLGSAEKINRFSSGFESSEKGKGFSFAGGELTNGTIFGQGVGGLGWQNNRGSKTAEQAMAEYQTELQQATLQALQSATDVPKLISSKLSGVNVDALSGDALSQLMATVDAQIAAVEGFRGSMLQLPFANMRDLSFGAAAGLIEVAGGIDALNTKLAAYYKDFYTDAERRAQVVATINAATAGTGLDAATATRESFRSLVESQDLATEAGQKTYAALIGVAGAFAEITPASEAAVQGLAAASDALKKLQSDTAELQVELLRAQGNTAGADAAQYKIDTAGMTDAERSIFDYNRALRDQITALTDASAAAEKNNAAIRTNAKSAIESAVAAFEKSKTNTSDALAALEKSIAAEKTRITVIKDVAAESVRSITSVFTALQEQVQQLYGTVSSTSAMQASQGNDYINNALSATLSTGYLPDAKELADAITAARTGLGPDKFSSKFESDKASLVLAGKLTQLQTASGKQLTEAERQLQVSNDQLAALDKSLDMYKQQVDALNGINTSVLSVADAVSGLLGAMQAQAAAKEAVQAAQAQGAASLYASNPNAVKNPGQEGLDFWQNQIASNGYDATATTFDASVAYVNDTVKSWYAGNPDAVKNPDSGAVQYWLDQIDAMGADAAKAKFSGVVGAMTGNAARPVNSFAVGINRVPFDMTAEIHKDEAIVPAVFNPFNPGAMTAGAGAGSDTRELLAEIRSLNARMERIEAHMANTSKNTERSALVLDDASRGKRPLKTEAAT